MRPLAQSSFDVALFLMERAREGDLNVQPRKLQRLLFLVQVHYAAENGDGMLMPSVFIVDDNGPSEPNLYQAFEHGRPKLMGAPLPEEADVFLDRIWDFYGGASPDQLQRIIDECGGGGKVLADKDGSEITREAMRRMFAKRNLGPSKDIRVMRTQGEMPITVERWIPGQSKKPTPNE